MKAVTNIAVAVAFVLISTITAMDTAVAGNCSIYVIPKVKSGTASMIGAKRTQIERNHQNQKTEPRHGGNSDAPDFKGEVVGVEPVYQSGGTSTCTITP